MFKGRYDIENLVKKVALKKHKKTLLKSELLELRDVFYNSVLKSGDLPSKEYLFLIDLFRNSELDDKKEFENYILTATVHLLKCDNIVEKLFLIHLKTICLIMNSRCDEAMEYYIYGIAMLDYRSIPHTDGYLNFFEIFCENVSFEIYFKASQNFFDPDFFFAIDLDTQKNILINNMIIFWSLKDVFVNKKIISVYELMLKIFNRFIDSKNLDMAMHISLSMLHFLSNTTPNFVKINEDIIRPLEGLIKEYAKSNLPKHHSKKHSIKRIGFLKDRIVFNSPYKVEYSLLKSLINHSDFNNKYKIYIYSFTTAEKALDNENCTENLRELGAEVAEPSFEQFQRDGFHYSYLEKANLIRSRIIQDEIDVLFDLTGSTALGEFMFSSRTAKQQIFFSHGNIDYDIDDIDCRASHFATSKKYEFKPFRMFMDTRYYDPLVDKNLIKKTRNLYPKDSFIIGTIGRLVKIDNDEYLETISEILKQNPATIYLACGVGGDVNRIKSKLKELEVLDRFYFPGLVNPHIYGHVIDLWANTFPPHTQGESMNEYMAKGGPTIGLFEPNVFDVQDDNIKNIKYDSSKLLIYIDNISKFDKNVDEYQKFIANPYYIILTDSEIKDENLRAKAVFGDTKFYDMRISIVDNKIKPIDAKFFIYKPLLYEHNWYIDTTEICRWIKENHKLALLNKNDHIWGYFCTHSKEEYIKKACILIQNPRIRNQFKKFNKAYMQTCKEIFQKHTFRDFEKIICAK